MGWLAGWLLVSCGRLALRRGDLHEVKHVAAALTAGNTARCTDEHCTLGFVGFDMGHP